MAQRQRDRRNDGHQQHHGSNLERVGVAAVQQRTQLLGIAVVGRQRRRAACHIDAQFVCQHYACNFEHDDTGHDPPEPGEAREPGTQLLQIDVDHHDHEQEQHHDRADVHQHQHYGQELGLDQQPDRR